MNPASAAYFEGLAAIFAPDSQSLRDGLWWVETPYLSAGFVVKDGRIVRCAPILRRRFGYWMTRAGFVTEIL